MELSINELDLLSRTGGEIIANCKEPRLAFRIRRECHCYTARAAHFAGPGTISRSRVIEIENRRVEMILAKRDARARARLPDPSRCTDHCNLINCDSCRPGANCSIIIH